MASGLPNSFAVLLLELLAVMAMPSVVVSQVSEPATLTARVEPPVVRPGEFATYSIEVNGGYKGEAPLIWLPQTFRAVNSVPTAEDYANVVQGVIVYSTRLTWRISTDSPGTFVIPAQEFVVAGKPARSSPVTVKVLQPPPIASKATNSWLTSSQGESLLGIVAILLLIAVTCYLTSLAVKFFQAVFRALERCGDRFLAWLRTHKAKFAGSSQVLWALGCLLVLLWLMMWPPWVQIGRPHIEVSLGMHPWWERPKFGQVETQRWLAHIGAVGIVFVMGRLVIGMIKPSKSTAGPGEPVAG